MTTKCIFGDIKLLGLTASVSKAEPCIILPLQ